MPQFRNLRRVRHSAAEMFDLVADVGAAIPNSCRCAARCGCANVHRVKTGPRCSLRT